MSIKRISLCAILAALLFVIYMSFSQILYLEFVTFTIVLFALNIPKWDNVWIVCVFVCLIWLVYGIGPWSLMYMIVYPGFTIILSLLKPLIKKHIYLIALLAFIIGLLAGNLIDLPFLLISKEVTVVYILMGIKTTIIQGLIAFITVLLIYQPLANNLEKLIENGRIYEKYEK